MTDRQNRADQTNPWDPSLSPDGQVSGADYVSNPFKVLSGSLKKLFTLNLLTLLKLAAAAVAPLVLLGALLFVALFVGADTLNLTPNHPLSIIGIVLAIAAAAGLVVWFIVIEAAFQWYGVMTARGEQLGFRPALRVGLDKWLGLLLVNLLRGLAILIGLFLFVVPGIVLAYWYSLAGYVYVDSKVGPIEALKHSRRLVKGKAAEIFGLTGVLLLVNLPTMVPLLGYVYSLITTPINKLTFAYRYTSARSLERSGRPKPQTSAANYAAIFLLPLLLILFVVLAVVTGDQPANGQVFGYVSGRG